MIDALVDAGKLFARPASVTFFVALLAVGVGLSFWRRGQRAARWYFVAVLMSYWVLASPAIAERLVQWEGGAYRPLASAADARGATMVVVLGAGNSTLRLGSLVINQVSLGGGLRVLEGARLYHLLDRPTILVSGGVTGRHDGARAEAEAMRDAIVGLGVPADHVMIESESKTTREEALVIARMLAGHKSQQPIVIVTSPTHMARSLGVFRAAGIDAIPSVAPIKPDHWSERHRWMPSEFGLLLLDSVVYDTAATVYYRVRGWM
ncbi:MAG TPA: YdcF family protein [Vicinamibacterales bacterium]|nr:YdcF family protein [Vicinamibacterales bacterium]